MTNPVLFLIFNRPDTTARVFEAIRQARPPRLYVAADGPRPTRAEEAALCQTTRRIATQVDWPCELSTLLREENLGCRNAVSSAIGWFFEHEPAGIVLEDDCLPDASFFPYCDEMLARYRDDERVMCISGDNFIASAWQPEASYYFSRYAHIWGWASWRRAWAHYRVDLSDQTPADLLTLLARVFPHSAAARNYWYKILYRMSQGRIDTWDYQWAYALWKQGGLSCVPQVNLISNIGFGAAATHTTNPESKLANLAPQSIPLPLIHPARIEATAAADHWTEANVFGIRPSAGDRFRSLVQSLRASLS